MKLKVEFTSKVSYLALYCKNGIFFSLCSNTSFNIENILYSNLYTPLYRKLKENL